ncbi:MAG TPA: phosphatase, partial [Pseudorhizobium sp.]|nr:phosphatase [Pseudorhizobium sp.]
MPQNSSLIRFGVIADPQYAPLPPNLELNRYFAHSLGKLDEAIATLNAQA